MRVVLDATAIPADRGGVGRYVDELVPALVRCGVALTVVCRPRDAGRYEEVGAAVAAAPAATENRGARLAWEQLGLPRAVRRARADVLHSPHYTMPHAAGAPTVVTLHDATFFSHPDLHSRVKRAFFRTATRHAVRHAASLVVPSRATAQEVRRHAGGDPALFHVAYHGVDRALFHPVGPAERERVRASLGLDGPYVAFLGTLEPRKNVPALVRGWARAVADRDVPPPLVLAGGRGWDQDVDPTVTEVTSRDPRLRVLRPGYLPLDDLPGLLAGAQVVAYPSLGEGFGLPVLEAMACGAVVLTTRRLSLPEVGGDAVAYCDTDADAVAAGLAALLDDAPRRATLAAAAVERARGFDWDTAARVHVAAYEQAARRQRRSESR